MLLTALLTCLLAQPAATPPAPPSAIPRPKLLIVVADPLAATPQLAPFVAHKQLTHDTQLVTLSAALAAGANPNAKADDPERLKRFLYARWKAGTGNVLLIGDADIMPVRYMTLDRVTPAAFDYAFYPCDLYYADVAKADGSFDDWNASKDGFHAEYFGEVRGEKNKTDPMNFDAVSYVPELALGRWPVSTPAELAVVAAKTTVYDLAVASETHAPIAAAVMVGGWIDARGSLDEFAKSIESASSGVASLPWSVRRLFYQDQTPQWSGEAPTEKAIVDLLNSGARLVLHAGHGSDDVWEQCLSVQSIAKMSNSACPAVMISAGCSTARFATLPPYEAYMDIHGVEHKGTDAGEVFTAPPPPPAVYARGQYNRTGLGERLLRDGPGGAVVYIGCNTGSQPAALSLMAGFVDALSHPPVTPTSPTLTAGDCWKHAVAYYVDHEHLATLKPTEDWYPASIYFQGMKFMFFGDPTVPMRRAPDAAAVQTPSR